MQRAADYGNGADKSKVRKVKPFAGPRDQTRGPVAHMVTLARVLTIRPDTKKARVSLARLTNEMLKKRADVVIARAIAEAPTRSIAQTIQRTAEGASEHVAVCRNGARKELSLFVIPIVTAFEKTVPESQFESALGEVDAWATLLAKRDGFDFASLVVLPKFFRLEELDAMPLSMVRERAIVLAKASTRGGNGWSAPTMQTGSFKRATAFLRYIVGQRCRSQDSVTHDQSLSTSLGELTSRAINRCLQLPCRVEVLAMQSFYQGMQSGEWIYQRTRLDQLSRVGRSKDLEARLVIKERRGRFELWIGFFVGDEAVDGRTYWLSAKPSEDPTGYVSRVSERLEANGIKVKVVTDFQNRRTGPSKQGSGVLSMVATRL
jgi:hypothetical protein